MTEATNRGSEPIWAKTPAGENGGRDDYVPLPRFPRGEMCRGMEDERRYALEELGLQGRAEACAEATEKKRKKNLDGPV